MNSGANLSPVRKPQAAAPRLYVPQTLPEGGELDLPPGAARHAQVLRLQPGDALTLFNGEGGECRATVIRMGRSSVQARIGAHAAIEREAARRVHLLAGLMASERMDWLVEKATELGAASLTPLLSQHCALRLSGPHAAKKHAHWQAVAVAACEQSGRNRLPLIHPPRPLAEGLAGLAGAQTVTLLSGPEGGLSAAEETQALAAGFTPVSLGARVLRAETAPVAALALLA